MSSRTKGRRIGTMALLLLAAVGGGASPPRASVTGTVGYRERVALRPGSVVVVTLEDVSRADAKAIVLARRELEPGAAMPIPFELGYDSGEIDARHSYVVRATIRRGDSLLFVTDRAYPVITRGHPSRVDLVLVRSGGGAAPVADADLVGTRWELRTLRGEAVEAGGKAPFVQLRSGDDGPQIFGDGGCNSFRGSFTHAGEALEFSPLATTRKACPAPLMDLEARFLRALADTRRYEIRATWLELHGSEGPVATFEAWYE